MHKLFFVFSFLVVGFISLNSSAFSFFSNSKATDLKSVVESAVGPYEANSAEYGNNKNSGDGYINILSLNIGAVDEDMSSSLEELIAEDRAKTEGTYLGQFNVINQTFSYCGLNGAVWGYHLAKAQIILDKERYQELKDIDPGKVNKEEAEELKNLEKKVKPLIFVKRDDGQDIPVYNGDPLINAGQKLLGTNDNKRFTVMPGAEVKCAEKKYIASGPKYLWSSIAFCVAEDRQINANLFIENAGEFIVRDKEGLKEFEKKIISDISHAALRFGKNNNITFKEIWVSSQIRWIPKGKVGCALAIVPYLTMAKQAIPSKGAGELVNMSLKDWEKDLKLSSIPNYGSSKNDFTTEYVNFETRNVESSGSGQGVKSVGQNKAVDENAWTPLQVGFFKEHYPSAEEYPSIYGLRLGLPITYNDNSRLYGVDLSVFFSATTVVKGLQFTVVGTQAKDIDGLQVSIANFAKENINGMQLGGVNYAEEMQGVQLGLVNYSNKAQGVQIGLVNYIEDGWLPFTLIINFNF